MNTIMGQATNDNHLAEVIAAAVKSYHDRRNATAFDPNTTNIIHDNCLDVMRRIPDNSFDAIITDPPYGMNYRNAAGDTILNDGNPFIWHMHDSHRVLKDDGVLVSFCNFGTLERWRVAIECAGFHNIVQLIWNKTTHGRNNSGVASMHENIFVATKSKSVPKREHLPSVLSHPRQSGGTKLHPTRKPVDLMRQLIESVVPPGGNILDPFAGSGSTGEAAIEAGRHVTLIEQVDKYIDVIREQMAKARPINQPLDEPDLDEPLVQPFVRPLVQPINQPTNHPVAKLNLAKPISVHELLHSGKDPWMIALRLNETGSRTPRGLEWNATHVRNALRRYA